MAWNKHNEPILIFFLNKARNYLNLCFTFLEAGNVLTLHKKNSGICYLAKLSKDRIQQKYGQAKKFYCVGRMSRIIYEKREN